MSGRKRQPSTLITIGQIYQGSMEQEKYSDQTFFVLNDEPIHKARIYGVVIDRYDGVSKAGRQFCSLTIDDGTDTIRATVWSRSVKEGDVEIFNPIHVVEGIEVGDIVDVLGKVREYQDQLYISPNNIAVKDIEWEIHRRTELVKSYLQTHHLLTEPRDLFTEQKEIDDQKEDSHELSDEAVPDTPPKETQKDFQKRILDAMDDDYKKNTIENIAKKTGDPLDLVRDAIKELQKLGSIYEPEEKRYAKLNAPV